MLHLYGVLIEFVYIVVAELLHVGKDILHCFNGVRLHNLLPNTVTSCFIVIFYMSGFQTLPPASFR